MILFLRKCAESRSKCSWTALYMLSAMFKTQQIKPPRTEKREDVTSETVCLYSTLVRYPRGDVRQTQNTKTNEGSSCVRMHVCHRGGGGQGGDSSEEQPPMISIKLDDALTYSIGSDVKHDKNVPDSISAPSSESYQRASSVSTKNKPLYTHTHTHIHTPLNTSHCSIFALHRNQGCVAVPRQQVYLKRKHLIFFFFFLFGSSSFLASLLNTQP